jgi:ABC-2 type transport system ATP-binding protein
LTLAGPEEKEPPMSLEATPDPVRTRALTKRYGERRAVDGVDLRVGRNQVFGLLGPNGAGKTTLLRMLTGLVRPTGGEVTVFGVEPGRPEALSRVGALIEGPGLYPHLSGRDNLRVLAHQTSAHHRVEHVLEQVGLSARARDKFGSYSLGMKQRLGVAAALLKNPELLVLDEPTNGLDPQGVRDMRGLVRELGEFGHTVLLSSHVMAEVEELCDWVAVMARGRIIREGTVAQLRGRGAVVVTAEPLQRALEVAADLYGTRAVLADGTLEVDIDDDDIPQLIHRLTSCGIRLRAVSRQESTLEDVFLQLTGEEVSGDAR